MQAKQFIEENLENMKKDLKSLIDINSVYSDDVKPFGSGPRKALDQALKLGSDTLHGGLSDVSK